MVNFLESLYEKVFGLNFHLLALVRNICKFVSCVHVLIISLTLFHFFCHMEEKAVQLVNG